jgi:hypothetical protein
VPAATDTTILGGWASVSYRGAYRPVDAAVSLRRICTMRGARLKHAGD